MAKLSPFLEVGFAAFSEVDVEVGQQVGPIALDGEQVVRASADEEVGELCLGEQGVGGEGFVGEVGFEGLKHGDDSADLVGVLGLFAGADGQAAYFFWVWVVWERWPTALRMWCQSAGGLDADRRVNRLIVKNWQGSKGRAD